MSRTTIVVDGVTVVVDGNGVEVIAIGGRKVIIPVARPANLGKKPIAGGHRPMEVRAPSPKPKAKPPKMKAPKATAAKAVVPAKAAAKASTKNGAGLSPEGGA